MPLRDYRCPKGHVTEQYHTTFVGHSPCAEPECGETAIYEPSFYYSSALNAQRFSPIVVHRDAEGNVRLPMHASAPVPPGFERVELRDFNAVRKFEHEINTKEAVKIQEHQHNRETVLNGQLKANREAMAQIIGKFSPKGRRFYEAMKEQSEKRQERFANTSLREANFHVEALSFNSSNREDYRDVLNNWGRDGKRR